MSSTSSMLKSSSPGTVISYAPHILVFPFPAQGHILALLDLTHQLALRNLTITILITPKNLRTLNPLLSLHSSINTLILPFPSHPNLPPGVEHVKDIGNTGNTPIIAALSKLEEPILQWFSTHPSPPTAIISDFFLGWTHYLANKIGIPRLAFFSVSSLLVCISDSLWRNLDIRGEHHAEEFVEFRELPRSPCLVQEHLPSIFKLYKGSDPDWNIVKRGFLANWLSQGCIFNSFQGLDGEYLDYMNKKLPHGRVYAVGPLCSMGGGGGGGSCAASNTQSNPVTELRSDVLKWLDTCPIKSVIYVCFGSQKIPSKPQMEALASALEQCQTRFIWVVKSGTREQIADGYGVVPDGFENRITGRGLVVKGWVPQTEILNHEAVGSFLSHCGWNSVLESVAIGMLVLAWPMEADQFVNAKLLVDYLGVAVKVCEGGSAVPEVELLARIIRMSLKGDLPQRKRVQELKVRVLESVGVGGSSLREVDELVVDLNTTWANSR